MSTTIKNNLWRDLRVLLSTPSSEMSGEFKFRIENNSGWIFFVFKSKRDSGESSFSVILNAIVVDFVSSQVFRRI